MFWLPVYWFTSIWFGWFLIVYFSIRRWASHCWMRRCSRRSLPRRRWWRYPNTRCLGGRCPTRWWLWHRKTLALPYPWRYCLRVRESVWEREREREQQKEGKKNGRNREKKKQENEQKKQGKNKPTEGKKIEETRKEERNYLILFNSITSKRIQHIRTYVLGLFETILFVTSPRWLVTVLSASFIFTPTYWYRPGIIDLLIRLYYPAY